MNIITTYFPAMRQLYWEAVAATIYGDTLQLAKWVLFRDELYKALSSTSVVSASHIRNRVTDGPSIEDLESVAQAESMLPWVSPHLKAVASKLEGQATLTAVAEMNFYRRKSEAYRSTGAEVKIAPSRLDMGWRMSSQQVKADAEQVQLADPFVGSQFPIARYVSRGDARVRETHAVMNGFMCYRDWSGYPKILTPAGWGCRCYIRFFTWREAVSNGWAHAPGKPKWQVMWPNSLAKKNFEGGEFPDKGWEQSGVAATRVSAPMKISA